MTDRLKQHLLAIRSRKRKALAFFYTAGYPTIDSTVPVGRALVAGGADMLELGMPFSDPLADGPVIQRSSEVALRNGMSLTLLLDQVRSLRHAVNVPIVLMGYMNPIMRYGSRRFFSDAATAGADGIILPELPVEEAGRYAAELRAAGLAQTLLVTPTTPPDRLSEIDSQATGFVYCVSMTGVTGGQAGVGVSEYLRGVRKYVTRNPMLVGFGISTPDQAVAMVGGADGVIIGSALIRYLGTLHERRLAVLSDRATGTSDELRPGASQERRSGASEEDLQALSSWVYSFRVAIDEGRSPGLESEGADT